jgi:hypothetical protein
MNKKCYILVIIYIIQWNISKPLSIEFILVPVLLCIYYNMTDNMTMYESLNTILLYSKVVLYDYNTSSTVRYSIK